MKKCAATLMLLIINIAILCAQDTIVNCSDGEICFDSKKKYFSSYSWNFGDGSTSNLEFPCHSYSSAGLYFVQIVANDACPGASDTALFYVRIHSSPNVKYALSPSTGCAPLNVNFSNTTISTLPVRYAWNFGSNKKSISSLASPSYNYTAPGTYIITLNATNICGTITQIKEIVVLQSLPDGSCPANTISGTLYSHPSCGGGISSGSTLTLISSDGDTTSVTSVLTDPSGGFSFDNSELLLLDTAKRYRIITTNGFAIEDTSSHKIDEWIALSPLSLHLRPINQRWKIDDISTSDTSKFIVELDVNGRIIVGSNTISNAGTSDFSLTKVSQSGNIIWNKYFDGGNNEDDYLVAMVVDNESNIYLLGDSYVNSNLQSAGVLTRVIKCDSNGNTIWSRTYDFSILNNSNVGPLNYSADIVLDQDQNLIIAGNSFSYLAPFGYHQLTYKVDKNGIIVWSKREVHPSNIYSDDVERIITDSKENIYIIANRQLLTGNGFSIKTISYNKNGSLRWEKYLPNTFATDFAYDIDIDGSDNILISGFTQSNSSSTGKIAKYDSLGNEIWSKSLEAEWSLTSRGYLISSDLNNNVYVAGELQLPTSVETIVSKFNANGDFLWSSTFSDSINSVNSPVNLAISPDNKPLIKILSYNEQFTQSKILLTGYNESGSLDWRETIVKGVSVGASFNRGGPLVDLNNRIFMDFNKTNDFISYDAGVASYDQCAPSPLNLRKGKYVKSFKKSYSETLSNPSSVANNNVKIAPNPNKGLFDVFLLNDNSTLSDNSYQIELFDYTGKLVLVSKNNQKQVSINLEEYPSGIYFLKATDNNGVSSVQKVMYQHD